MKTTDKTDASQYAFTNENWYNQYPNGPYWIIPDYVFPYNPVLPQQQPIQIWNTGGLMPTYVPIQNPEVNIMVNNNRVAKTASNDVYLNDGEFAIEMINKSTVTLGAKIKLNNQYISTSHLILYPGQRIVLDRYIDTKDKFKFTVYTVDKNNATVEQAIKNNGDLEIEFYQEEQQSSLDINTKTYFAAGNTTNSNYYCNTLTNNTFGSALNDEVIGSRNLCYFEAPIPTQFKETGLVEKGSDSDQSLTYVNKKFSYWTLVSYKFKLLPLSEKPIEAKDLINYCSNCGHKTKRQHKFCSNCGTKI